MTLNELIESVDYYIGRKELPPIAVRIKEVEALCELYYQKNGAMPPSYQLDRLGSYLLADELRDKGTHKVKKAEYPVLSPTQIKLRNRRERRVGDENLDFIKNKEIDNNPNAFKKRTDNKEAI